MRRTVAQACRTGTGGKSRERTFRLDLLPLPILRNSAAVPRLGFVRLPIQRARTKKFTWAGQDAQDALSGSSAGMRAWSPTHYLPYETALPRIQRPRFLLEPPGADTGKVQSRSVWAHRQVQ